jgi:phytoene synthase
VLTPPEGLEQSYTDAGEVTRRWARSFHFASSFLPWVKRRSVYALYDYCRHADNLVDLRGSRPPTAVRRDLDALRVIVRALHAGEVPTDARWLGLWDTMRRYPVPLDPLLALIDGVEGDLALVRIPDFATLHTYCLRVAGGVGLMLGPVLGADSDEFRQHGIDLGVAMQLTNILRDIREDLAEGRIYLPADEMAAHGVTEEMLRAGRMTRQLHRLVSFQVLRARYYFGLGDAVIDDFPDDGSRLTVRLMQRIYAGILDELERQGLDIFRGRAMVSPTRKIMILGRTLLTA